MDISTMGITELKALLFDLTIQGQNIQKDYNTVAVQLQKKLQEERAKAVVEKTVEDKKKAK